MKSTLTTMLLSLTGIALTVGAALAAVHSVTEEPIAEAAVKARNAALGEILPAFDNDIAATAEVREGLTVYTAKTGEDTVGYAVETYSDNGFSGHISILAGFDSSGALHGYRVMSHAETPGLGDKMCNWFCVEGTSHNVIGSTTSIVLNKDGGDIDAITGATISSRAFAEAVNRARATIFKSE